jgi:hypothetical protein
MTTSCISEQKEISHTFGRLYTPFLGLINSIRVLISPGNNTSSRKSKMAVAKPKVFENSAYRLDKKAISTAIPPFPWFNTLIRLLGSLRDITGGRESKIVVAKPEVLITPLID